MEMFFSELRYRSEDLWTAADIVQHSFIVQNSISPLNLELCQSYNLWDGYTEGNCPSFSHSKEIINTEEKCRKIFTKSRDLFYTLHLDLPRGREWSLKSDSLPRNVSPDWAIPHVAKIYVYNNFYTYLLYDFIDYACRHSDDKLKVLRWFIKFDVLENSVFRELPHSSMNYFFECMHPELDDPEFVTECFRKLDLNNWVLTSHSSKPGRASNLFYQLHQNRRNLDELWIDEFIGFCVCVSFQHVGDVLKLNYTPNLYDDAFSFFLDGVVDLRGSLIPREILANMSEQRDRLLYQVFWVYINRSEDLPAAAEYLRLIWNSVPDSFLTFKEIEAAFKEGIDSAETTDIYNFYSEAIQIINMDLHPVVAPRSLKHYSRTVIRRILSQNGHWLPDGIKEIGLPKTLQSYLNLE